MNMRLIAVLVVALGIPSVLQAQGPLREPRSKGPILQSATREAARLEPARQSQPAQTTADRSWVAKHPILLGSIIGFGVGAVIGAQTCYFPAGDQGSCKDFTYPRHTAGALFVGGVGAGIGAGVGALIAAARQP